MSENIFQKISHEIRESINLARSHVFDCFEVEFADSANWQSIRSRLLRIFGDRGLEGRLQQIISDNTKSLNGHGDEGHHHVRFK